MQPMPSRGQVIGTVGDQTNKTKHFLKLILFPLRRNTDAFVQGGGRTASRSRAAVKAELRITISGPHVTLPYAR